MVGPGWHRRPLLFALGFLTQEFFRRGEYNPIIEPVSALEAGPNGWIQQVNFLVFGVFIVLFVLGLHRGIRRTRAGVAGPAILTWSGVGLILAAAFPLRDDPAGNLYDPTGLHMVNGTIFFFSLGVGLIVVSGGSLAIRDGAGSPDTSLLAGSS